MIQAVDHINIVVSDMDRSVRFYRDLLGLEVTREAHLEGDWIESIVGLKDVHADVVYLEPEGGGMRIELLRYHSPQGQALPANAQPNTVGLRHIAFRVTDIQAVCERLQKAGVELIGSPVKVPGKVVKHDAGDKVLCYFRDPDGVLLELAEYR